MSFLRLLPFQFAIPKGQGQPPLRTLRGFSGLHFRDLALGDRKVNAKMPFLAVHKGGDQNNARSIYLHVLEFHLRFTLLLFLEMVSDSIPRQGHLPDFKQLACYSAPTATAAVSVRCCTLMGTTANLTSSCLAGRRLFQGQQCPLIFYNTLNKKINPFREDKITRLPLRVNSARWA